jgi:hypothetical protein
MIVFSNWIFNDFFLLIRIINSLKVGFR